MAGKEGTVFLMDVSPSMQKNRMHEEAHIDLLSMIHMKLIESRKSDLVGLILMGTHDTANHLSRELGSDYDHLKIYDFDDQETKFIKAADAALAHYVKLGTERGDNESDVIGGLVLALHMFSSQFAKMNVLKRIFVLTNLSTPLFTDGMDQIADKTVDMGVKITFIIYPTDNVEIAKENLVILNTFVERIQGSIIESIKAREILLLPKTKSIKPVPTFRGNLVLGDEFGKDDTCSSIVIPIIMYNKTTEFKPPSANMWTSKGKLDHSVTRTTEYLYKVNDGNLNDVENLPDEFSRNELVKSYYYGRKLVPVYADDEKMWELKTTKGFDIIGFVATEKVPRHYLSGAVMLVIPDRNDLCAVEAFSALVTALYEKNSYALVRYCRIADASPKLGILSCSPKGHGLFCKIPFKDDIRTYSFPVIPWELYNNPVSAVDVKKRKMDTRTVNYKTARSALSDFVDSMSLSGIKKTKRYLYKNSSI